MTCKSVSCFESHKTAKDKKQSPCTHWWKCTICKKIVDRNKMNVEEHVCDTYYCKSCEKVADTISHHCYIRSISSKETLPRYIFFDFETTQEDEIMQCKDGYLSVKDPNCSKCKELGTVCPHCSLCKNCLQSDCGKFTHEPSMVVASTVCELCIDDDSNASQSKCDLCGFRCRFCNKINKKENSYEKLPCRGTCGFREVVFKGENCKRDFGNWLFSPAHTHFTAITHNAKGFDNYFILEYLIDNSIRPEIIYSGSKIMYLHVHRGLDIRFVDSLNFLPMKLAKLPEAFGLNELKKGFFPYMFIKKEHFNYTGAYPPSEYYCPDYMNMEERCAFFSWYQDKIDSGEQFDFQKEILEYCRSDVDILRNACLKFRQIILSITGNSEVHLDYAEDTRNQGGIDPFSQITIAGVCMKIFKTKFLPENWEVKVRKGNEISEWLPAKLLDGNMSVVLNGIQMSGDQLQENGYLIEEKKFVSTPIAQVPSYGYSSSDTYSMASIQWLEWYMEEQNGKGNPIRIRHALNGGEMKIPGTHYRVDGYTEQMFVSETGGTSKKQIIAFDFYGCFWHGCRTCFPNQRRQSKLPRTGLSLEELWTLTVKREQCIKSLGIKHISIWEHEFAQRLSSNETAAKFVKSLDLQERLDTRDAFYGGRVNATQLYYKVNSEEKISYFDICSLYPSVNKYCSYPVKEPTIVTSNFDNIDHYFGIAKVKILPPRNLYHPVLPLRIKEKLLFSLCRTCAEQQNQKPCKCRDEDRHLLGTWCTPEIQKAVERGYVILKIYEVYHWNETKQFDKETGENGLFAGYINMFLKLKQEASGWPDWVKTENDAVQYLVEYREKEGITLDRENIKQNTALRSIAKILLNSFWGKFGEKLRKSKTSFFHESEADKFFQCVSNPSKTVKDFHIISDDMIQLTWEDTENLLNEDYKTNIFIATFTTCWARLKLDSLLEMLDRRALYFDTDSIIFVSRPGDTDPKIGSFLGELTNELKKSGDHIVEYVSGGPKNYAYRTFLGEQVCKVKGFSLNYINSQLINLSSILQLITRPREDTEQNNASDPGKNSKRKKREQKSENKIVVTNPRKITRQKLKRKLYNREEQKEYRIVYTKRAIENDSYNTLPYGY